MESEPSLPERRASALFSLSPSSASLRRRHFGRRCLRCSRSVTPKWKWTEIAREERRGEERRGGAKRRCCCTQLGSVHARVDGVRHPRRGGGSDGAEDEWENAEERASERTTNNRVRKSGEGSERVSFVLLYYWALFFESLKRWSVTLKKIPRTPTKSVMQRMSFGACSQD